MKKFAFLSIIALGLGMVSCDDFDYPNPPAQSNPQEPVFESANLKLVSTVASDVDLIAANNADKAVVLADLESVEGLPEGFDLSFVGQLAGNENFGAAKDFAVSFDGKTISAAADDLDAAYHEALGTIDPRAKNVYIRFKAYAESTTETIPAYRLGGSDTYFGSVTTLMAPFDPGFAVEDTYYLIYSSDAETWTKADALKFDHSAASPYDDPAFSVICNFSAEQVGDGLYWKIIPQTTYDSFDLANGLVIGVKEKDSESRSGDLDESAEQLAGYFDIVGPALFEINVRDLTFSYKQAIENFWLAGDDVNGLSWAFGAEPTMWTNNYVNYAGIAVLGTEFKFSPQAGWGGDFGCTNEPVFETTEGGELVGNGKADGGKNIKVAEPGLYYISLNYATKDLQLVKLASWGIIGGFNDWGSSVEMTKVDDFTYTVTQDITEGTEWKFRANDQWTVSLGGEFDNLDPFNGSNFKCDATGTYEITLDLRNLPWTAKVVKK